LGAVTVYKSIKEYLGGFESGSITEMACFPAIFGLCCGYESNDKRILSLLLPSASNLYNQNLTLDHKNVKNQFLGIDSISGRIFTYLTSSKKEKKFSFKN
jgi:hypothetical protein